MIVFRNLQIKDIPKLYTWVNLPNVKRWWENVPATFEAVEEKYTKRIEDNQDIKCFIIEMDQKDIGYIQAYFDVDQSLFLCEGICIGIDLFIADEAYLHKGYGHQIILAFIDSILKPYHPDFIVIDPDADNIVAIKSYMKAGFVSQQIRLCPSCGTHDTNFMVKSMKKEVIVTEYQKRWEQDFLDLKTYFSDHIVCPSFSIEHIGSTSVKGLPAKPIIDLIILIPDPTHFDSIKSSLEKINYFHLGNQGIPEREVFKSIVPSVLYPHHLYVSYPDAVSTRNQLTLRNHLRTHDEDRDQYGKLKQELAHRYPHDIDSYVSGKTDFILSILKQYEFNASELEEIIKINQ